MSGAAMPPAAPAAPTSALGDLLARSLQELVAAGRVDAACRLAGLACAATRRDDVRTWKRFNALLHRWSAGAPEPSRPAGTARAIESRPPQGGGRAKGERER